MKKVALAINYDYHDYGGMLQAFATQRALLKLGIDSEAIDFENLKGDITKRKWQYFLTTCIKTNDCQLNFIRKNRYSFYVFNQTRKTIIYRFNVVLHTSTVITKN